MRYVHYISSMIGRHLTVALYSCGLFKGSTQSAKETGAFVKYCPIREFLSRMEDPRSNSSREKRDDWYFDQSSVRYWLLFGRGSHYPEIRILFLFLCQVCKQGMWLCLQNERYKRLRVIQSDVCIQCVQKLFSCNYFVTHIETQRSRHSLMFYVYYNRSNFPHHFQSKSSDCWRSKSR